MIEICDKMFCALPKVTSYLRNWNFDDEIIWSGPVLLGVLLFNWALAVLNVLGDVM